MTRKPMLAADHDPSRLAFPYYGSYKLDGYRAFNEDGVLYTRSGKPIPNRYAQHLFGRAEFHGMDGELIVGAWNDPNAFNATSGPLRRIEGEPDVHWYLFDDRSSPSDIFSTRFTFLSVRVGDYKHFGKDEVTSRLHVLDQVIISDDEELEAVEDDALMQGFEGLMLRSPHSPYKFGRSTVIENYLLKVKRYDDAEAIIVDIEEQMINDNVSFINELGYKKRSEHRDGLRPSGMVGAFFVESPDWPRRFKIQCSRMKHEEKRHAFQHPAEFIGQMAKFKFFKHGIKDVPRHGQFMGLRDPADM